MNPYDELGLSKTATQDEIRQQYKILAQQYHPDRGGDEEKFKKIKLAYELLNDLESRAYYDSTGEIPEVDNIRSEALGNLANILSQHLINLNVDTDDLILLMKRDIVKMKAALTTDIKTCGDFILKLEKILKKIKRKRQGENILKNFVEQQVTLRKNEMSMFTHRLSVCELMIEILEDYHFSLEEWTLLLAQQSTAS